ncbi:dihydroxyacetone kinase subunit DhaK [Synergistales bacterium]|nr:dihydroxyacetone kinase subunit DhaK [Synergistales bacterium]
MKKIINKPENIIPELVEGFVSANSRYFEKVLGVNGILYKGRRKDKVTLVIGGGSGHEPIYSGFIGRGLGDASVAGNIFASPDPGAISETAKAAHAGHGILFVYGNYAGDNLNFDMAEEILQDDGVKAAHVRINDDCVSAPVERINDRRGIAGGVLMVRLAGAACDLGLSLEDTKKQVEHVADNLRTIGIAVSPGQLPGLDKPTFELGDDEIEFGMGLHGEPGIKRDKMRPADELVDVMFSHIVKDMPLKAGEEVCVLVNGLGATTMLELSIAYRRVKQLLDKAGVLVYDADVNSYATSQSMGGFSISILKLDEQIKKLYDNPCFCPFYAKEGKA